MDPVLKAWPAKKRTAWFVPMAAGIFLLAFLIVAFGTQSPFLAMLLPPILGVAGAYVLLGWPQIQTKDGKPLIEPKVKPYLFFVLAPFFAIVLYPIFGIALTQVGLPLKWLAIVSILLAATSAVTLAYLLVGIPNVYAAARKQYTDIPPERRPYLFFPLFVLFFLVLFLTLGVVSTKLVGTLAAGEDPSSLLNLQVLVLLPLCLLVAGLLAWLLVGIPKVLTAPAQHMPRVPGRHRPRAFFLTLLLLGIALTYVIGAILTYAVDLPGVVVLPLALLLGYVLSAGVALLAWGTPAKWRAHDDYRPALPPEARTPLRVLGAIALGVVVVVAFGLAGIDLFWGVLVGALVTGIAILFATGVHRAIFARRNEETLVPDLPDGLKAILFFATWIVLAFVLFAILTFLLPGLVAVNALVGIVVGLAVGFLVLEQPLLKELREERRRERAKRKEWEARRKARLDEAKKEGQTP